MGSYRYGPYTDGPDPLAPPYDARGALDALGDSVLEGSTPGDALRALQRSGVPGRRGLDDLLRRVRERQREIRSSGRLDGTLDQVRSLLDTAIGQERAELFPDPSDEARMREADLDALPSDTAQAVRQLADYEWRSGAARETFDRLKDLLRREVLDSQFRGMKQALQSPDPEAMQRVKDMLADLNAMLEADARGAHTSEDFERFMENYADLFPDNPENLEELVDSLIRRMAAAERLLASLSQEQREELANLMAQALDDAGLAVEMSRLSDMLRARRPDAGSGQGEMMMGEEPLGLGDATTALAELADLAELETALGQDYRAPGSTTSTRRRSAGPSGARRSTTSKPSAGWSGNWNSRATSTATEAGWSSPPARYAGWAKPRCGGCSPDCPRGAGATTTGAMPGRPGS